MGISTDYLNFGKKTEKNFFTNTDMRHSIISFLSLPENGENNKPTFLEKIFFSIEVLH